MSILMDLKDITLRSEIPEFLKTHGRNRFVAEVGVRFGYNFQQLITCNPEIAFAIDHWNVGKNKAEQDTGLTQVDLEKIYQDIFKRFMYYPNVRILRMRSDYGPALFPKAFFDYVYLDADHSYEGCLRDIKCWWPLVRQGGILAGHDYIETDSRNGTSFGVIQAVEEWKKEIKQPANSIHFTREGYKSWYIYKIAGE